ncbi:MAG: type I glyceraldehyde-3-phosphate dehydrogenase [Candidatus Heimdallarchaeota archaeon]|nr:type I glyceraldehyde-3-phosphate dehydrogenase [Candidatus Heimdallarchaeota archaeon]
MVVKVGINGFGRIGRLVLRALMEMKEKVDITAINDIADKQSLAHLFEYDTVHGKFEGSVEVTQDSLIFNGDDFLTFSEKDPSNLPWGEMDTDVVIECTGRFRTRADLQKHIDAGSKKVILSAPSNTENDVDITIVRGINNNLLKADHNLISNASCTTNCLAPVVKVLDDRFKFDNGVMTTIHAYTNDQRLLDSVHKDFRKMRASALNMFPTSTGASKAIGLVLPHLNGKIDGIAIRIPTANVSIVDLSAHLLDEISLDEVSEAFIKASQGYLTGIMTCESRPLVSSDFNHNSHSSIIDMPFLKVVNKHMVKVLAWYDNEWGYANRSAELIHEIYNKFLR